MTPLGWLGRKTSTQTNIYLCYRDPKMMVFFSHPTAATKYSVCQVFHGKKLCGIALSYPSINRNVRCSTSWKTQPLYLLRHKSQLPHTYIRLNKLPILVSGMPVKLWHLDIRRKKRLNYLQTVETLIRRLGVWIGSSLFANCPFGGSRLKGVKVKILIRWDISTI